MCSTRICFVSPLGMRTESEKRPQQKIDWGQAWKIGYGGVGRRRSEDSSLASLPGVVCGLPGSSFWSWGIRQIN